VEILLASPPGLFGDALAALIGKLDPQCKVHRFPDAPAAMVNAAQPTPSDMTLALVDVDVDDAPTVIRAFSGLHPGKPIVAMGTQVNDAFIDSLLSAGATGYLPKHFSEPVIIGVLKLVLGGASYRPYLPKQPALPPSSADASAVTPTRDADTRREFGLSERQMEVLTLAAQGKSNQAIANQLGITEGTVKLHMTAVLRALNVENRSEAVVIATRMNSVNFRQIREAESGRLDMDWLLPHMTHQRLAISTVIFRKGAPGDRLYYLQRGTVRLQEINLDLASGTLFGEIGIFAPRHERTCTAICTTDVDLFTLSEAQVKRLYFLNPPFAIYVVQLIAAHLSADRDRSV
jgi:DNA-binding NarL/FixJ family response regulator